MLPSMLNMSAVCVELQLGMTADAITEDWLGGSSVDGQQATAAAGSQALPSGVKAVISGPCIAPWLDAATAVVVESTLGAAQRRAEDSPPGGGALHLRLMPADDIMSSVFSLRTAVNTVLSKAAGGFSPATLQQTVQQQIAAVPPPDFAELLAATSLQPDSVPSGWRAPAAACAAEGPAGWYTCFTKVRVIPLVAGPVFLRGQARLRAASSGAQLPRFASSVAASNATLPAMISAAALADSSARCGALAKLNQTWPEGAVVAPAAAALLQACAPPGRWSVSLSVMPSAVPSFTAAITSPAAYSGYTSSAQVQAQTVPLPARGWPLPSVASPTAYPTLGWSLFTQFRGAVPVQVRFALLLCANTTHATLGDLAARPDMTVAEWTRATARACSKLALPVGEDQQGVSISSVADMPSTASTWQLPGGWTLQWQDAQAFSDFGWRPATAAIQLDNARTQAVLAVQCAGWVSGTRFADACTPDMLSVTQLNACNAAGCAAAREALLAARAQAMPALLWPQQFSVSARIPAHMGGLLVMQTKAAAAPQWHAVARALPFTSQEAGPMPAPAELAASADQLPAGWLNVSWRAPLSASAVGGGLLQGGVSHWRIQARLTGARLRMPLHLSDAVARLRTLCPSGTDQRCRWPALVTLAIASYEEALIATGVSLTSPHTSWVAQRAASALPASSAHVQQAMAAAAALIQRVVLSAGCAPAAEPTSPSTANVQVLSAGAAAPQLLNDTLAGMGFPFQAQDMHGTAPSALQLSAILDAVEAHWNGTSTGFMKYAACAATYDVQVQRSSAGQLFTAWHAAGATLLHDSSIAWRIALPLPGHSALWALQVQALDIHTGRAVPGSATLPGSVSPGLSKPGLPAQLARAASAPAQLPACIAVNTSAAAQGACLAQAGWPGAVLHPWLSFPIAGTPGGAQPPSELPAHISEVHSYGTAVIASVFQAAGAALTGTCGPRAVYDGHTGLCACAAGWAAVPAKASQGDQLDAMPCGYPAGTAHLGLVSMPSHALGRAHNASAGLPLPLQDPAGATSTRSVARPPTGAALLGLATAANAALSAPALSVLSTEVVGPGPAGAAQLPSLAWLPASQYMYPGEAARVWLVAAHLPSTAAVLQAGGSSNGIMCLQDMIMMSTWASFSRTGCSLLAVPPAVWPRAAAADGNPFALSQALVQYSSPSSVGGDSLTAKSSLASIALQPEAFIGLLHAGFRGLAVDQALPAQAPRTARMPASDSGLPWQWPDLLASCSSLASCLYCSGASSGLCAWHQVQHEPSPTSSSVCLPTASASSSVHSLPLTAALLGAKPFAAWQARLPLARPGSASDGLASALAFAAGSRWSSSAGALAAAAGLSAAAAASSVPPASALLQAHTMQPSQPGLVPWWLPMPAAAASSAAALPQVSQIATCSVRCEELTQPLGNADPCDTCSAQPHCMWCASTRQCTNITAAQTAILAHTDQQFISDMLALWALQPEVEGSPPPATLGAATRPQLISLSRVWYVRQLQAQGSAQFPTAELCPPMGGVTQADGLVPQSSVCPARRCVSYSTLNQCTDDRACGWCSAISSAVPEDITFTKLDSSQPDKPSWHAYGAATTTALHAAWQLAWSDVREAGPGDRVVVPAEQRVSGCTAGAAAGPTTGVCDLWQWYAAGMSCSVRLHQASACAACNALQSATSSSSSPRCSWCDAMSSCVVSVPVNEAQVSTHLHLDSTPANVSATWNMAYPFGRDPPAVYGAVNVQVPAIGARCPARAAVSATLAPLLQVQLPGEANNGDALYRWIRAPVPAQAAAPRAASTPAPAVSQVPSPAHDAPAFQSALGSWYPADVPSICKALPQSPAAACAAALDCQSCQSVLLNETLGFESGLRCGWCPSASQLGGKSAEYPQHGAPLADDPLTGSCVLVPTARNSSAVPLDTSSGALPGTCASSVQVGYCTAQRCQPEQVTLMTAVSGSAGRGTAGSSCPTAAAAGSVVTAPQPIYRAASASSAGRALRYLAAQAMHHVARALQAVAIEVGGDTVVEYPHVAVAASAAAAQTTLAQRSALAQNGSCGMRRDSSGARLPSWPQAMPAGSECTWVIAADLSALSSSQTSTGSSSEQAAIMTIAVHAADLAPGDAVRVYTTTQATSAPTVELIGVSVPNMVVTSQQTALAVEAWVQRAAMLPGTYALSDIPYHVMYVTAERPIVFSIASAHARIELDNAQGGGTGVQFSYAVTIPRHIDALFVVAAVVTSFTVLCCAGLVVKRWAQSSQARAEAAANDVDPSTQENMVWDEAQQQYIPRQSGATAAQLAMCPVIYFKPDPKYLLGTVWEGTSESEWQCSISLEAFEEGTHVRVLPCGHAFEDDSIRRWMIDHTTCPLCKQSIPDALTQLKRDIAAGKRKDCLTFPAHVQVLHASSVHAGPASIPTAPGARAAPVRAIPPPPPPVGSSSTPAVQVAGDSASGSSAIPPRSAALPSSRHTPIPRRPSLPGQAVPRRRRSVSAENVGVAGVADTTGATSSDQAKLENPLRLARPGGAAPASGAAIELASMAPRSVASQRRSSGSSVPAGSSTRFTHSNPLLQMQERLLSADPASTPCSEASSLPGAAVAARRADRRRFSAMPTQARRLSRVPSRAVPGAEESP